jgi:XTP/dITP diphosphohydrolase
MKQVYFATTNQGKVKTLNSGLSKYEIEAIQAPLELKEPSDDVARTLEEVQKLLNQQHNPALLLEIARTKVLAAYEQLGKPCVALDAGFYVHSLNGFPGAFVNVALKTENFGIEGILRETKGKPRDCKFVNCLAYLDDSLSEPVYFESHVPGTLSEEPRGEKRDYFWSDLFFVFIPEGYDKTLAEMSPEEFQEFRVERLEESFSTTFAKWFSKRQNN